MIEIPGYTIRREISVGLLASVYMARQNSLDREVALKILSSTAAEDPALAQRFQDQARLMAALSHPNIVAVYDVGATAGQAPYFSMQYLTGGDFEERVKRGISEHELTEMLTAIARALGYIHNRGLSHRGLSPTKILYDASNVPMLTDFGIAASAQESHLTSAGFAVGNTHYMSPEQARGGEVDARSDIYSLGVLCYFGLTGRPPYDGADGFAIAYAHVFEPIPRLPASRAHWQQLIDDALAKDPKERYARVEDFLDALTGVSLDADMPAAVAKSDTPKPFESTVKPVAEEKKPAAETMVAASIPKPIIEKEPIVPAPPELPVTVVPVAVPVVRVEPPSKLPASETTVLRPAVPAAREPVLKSSKPTPPRGVAVAPSKPSASRNWIRWWPLPVAAIGIALIVAAIFSRPAVAPKGPPPAVVAPAAPVVETPSPSPPAANATSPPPVPSLPSSSVSSTSAALNNSAVNDAANATPPHKTEIASAMDAVEAVDAKSDEAVETDPSKIPTVVDPVVEAVRLGRGDLAAQRLTSPAGANALERFQFALKIDPKNKAAKQGIVDIAKKYTDLADKAQTAGNAAQFTDFLDHAESTAKLVPEGQDVLKDVAQRRQKTAAPFIAQAKTAAAAWDRETAKAAYDKALQIDPQNQTAKDGLKFVATIGEPGFVFHDDAGGARGPEMIILAGAKLAMERHDVTRGEFRRYWNSAGKTAFAGRDPGCRDRESIFRSSKKRNWENPDIAQDDSHPVVCVSWGEAAGFATWLSQQTGKKYRLLSPAEFDRVASRAAAPSCSAANIADASFNHQYDSRDGNTCDDSFAATSPVGHFEPSADGIYDIDGNVRTWVGACAGGGAAQAGSACRDFMVKGRAWISPAKEAATRSDTFASDVSLNTVGFRLVREID